MWSASAYLTPSWNLLEALFGKPAFSFWPVQDNISWVAIQVNDRKLHLLFSSGMGWVVKLWKQVQYMWYIPQRFFFDFRWKLWPNWRSFCKLWLFSSCLFLSALPKSRFLFQLSRAPFVFCSLGSSSKYSVLLMKNSEASVKLLILVFFSVVKIVHLLSSSPQSWLSKPFEWILWRLVLSV